MKIKENIIKILKSPLTYILLVSIFIQGFFYGKVTAYTTSADTVSYLAPVYKENIFLGQVNYLRTPVYPYFCKFIELFSNKSNFYLNIVLCQKILFFISIIIFYLTVKKLFKNKCLYSIITLIYAVCPFLFLWNTMILTEALSIVEITTLLYLTVSYIKNPKKSSAILIGIQLLIMVMTRPANIYLLLAYFMFWVLKYCLVKDISIKRTIKTGFITLLITIGLVLLYCNQVRVQHGHFGLSSVSNVNSFVSLIDSNLYSYGNNKKIVKAINKKYSVDDDDSAWVAYFYVNKNFELDEMNEFVKSARSNAGLLYIKYIIKKALSCGTYNLGAYYSEPNSVNTSILYNLAYNLFPITFSTTYYFVVGALLFLLYYLIKKKDIEWVVAALVTIIAGNLILAIVFAPHEWQRLSLITIPTIIILIPYLICELFNLSLYDTKKKRGRKKINNKSKKNNNNILMDNINEFFGYLFKFDIKKLFREASDNTIIQFFRYLFVGGIAAVVNVGMLYVFTDLIHINYIISNVLSFTLGLFVNYILSKKFVFQGETTISKSKEFVIYAIIGVLGLGIDTLLVWLFTDICGLYYMISKLVSTMIVFVWNFSARKVLYKVIK